MRTNIVLDDQLIQEALKYAGVRTKREVVALALEEFVANRRRRDLRALRGRGGIAAHYDHKRLREGR